MYILTSDMKCEINQSEYATKALLILISIDAPCNPIRRNLEGEYFPRNSIMKKNMKLIKI